MSNMNDTVQMDRVGRHTVCREFSMLKDVWSELFVLTSVPMASSDYESDFLVPSRLLIPTWYQRQATLGM